MTILCPRLNTMRSIPPFAYLFVLEKFKVWNRGDGELAGKVLQKIKETNVSFFHRRDSVQESPPSLQPPEKLSYQSDRNNLWKASKKPLISPDRDCSQLQNIVLSFAIYCNKLQYMRRMFIHSVKQACVTDLINILLIYSPGFKFTITFVSTWL